MDKLNYTLEKNEIQDIKAKIHEIKSKVIKAIKKSKIIQRKRVVKKYSTLVQAAILYIIEKLSFQRLSDTMAVKYGIVMSDTSWKKQISKIAPIFYEVMMSFLNQKSVNTTDNILGFSSAYAIDATDIALEGKKGTVLRAHTEYDITDKSKFQAVIADIHTGESVRLHNIKSGSLYFADRAYGRTPQMAYVISHNADFVFRFSPTQVRLFEDADCTRKIDFVSYLQNFDTTFSLDCFLKFNNKIHKIRTIISPIPKEKIDDTIKKVKKKSVKKQNKLSPSTISYAKWMFLATSLANNIEPEEIVLAYRKRWQIELHFKRSKSLLGFHRIRRGSFFYSYCTVSLWLAVTALIYMLFETLSLHKNVFISTFNSFSLFAFMLS